ncbi:hypothetical protein P8452_18771 [Trifolium repens]|nr:hypothetical protein P8452_18771 [Trifolium repens]
MLSSVICTIPSLISPSSFRFVLCLRPSSFKLQIHSQICSQIVLLRFLNLQLQSSKSRYVYLNKFNLNKKT